MINIHRYGHVSCPYLYFYYFVIYAAQARLQLMDSSLSDEELMLAYAAGDTAAFESLYLKHKGPVYRYMLKLCCNEAVAEELYQEVWMKLIKARENYQVKAKFTTYLYKLAHNQFIDHYRKQNVRIVEDQSIEVDDVEPAQLSGNNPEKQTQTNQAINKLSELLDALPNEQREVFLLREEAGMSVSEIAETLGINQEAAKSRLRYAINKLRTGLNEE
ncbi:MAG TPA: RNA polymerase sigma factor [Thiotrichaceae bacterium]|nr:RNA polymerase sigma factor [Thiotrichaceae bacterium]HIM08723.1 RNA polymerase sigma factor [Gammaproteobacteria bacterium]